MRHDLLALVVLSLASTVDAGVIYVKKGATGANNGTSWNDAFAELRDALPASAPNDELWIAQGTYTPATSNDSFFVNGRKLYGGFSGNETLLDQRNWATWTTILSGDLLGDDVGFGGSDNCKHIVRVSSGSSALDGVIIEGGVALGSGPDGQGAGIYFDPGSGPISGTLLNCILRRNTARRGGALYVPTGTLHVNGCLFTQNYAQGQGAADGGSAIYRPGTDSMVVLQFSTLVDNTASQVGPGIGTVLFDDFANGALIYASIFSGNPAPSVLPNPGFTACCIDFPMISSGVIVADPQFVSPATGDFRLRANSPCIDGAVPGPIPWYLRDLACARRSVGDPSKPPYSNGSPPTDIGAFEFAPDCNGNGTPDFIEVEQGLIRDMNGNSLPDECEPLGTSICFGDGTAAACPCGNVGALGRACENSSGTGGGRIYAIGLAKVTHDTVLLHVDGLGPMAPALFFQGNGLDLVGGSTGLPFGDGLRCVFGQILRLPIKNCVNGQASTGAGVPGDVKISILGAPVTPGTRYYQAWYRDSASFCTPAFYNMTNAVQITWIP